MSVEGRPVPPDIQHQLLNAIRELTDRLTDLLVPKLVLSMFDVAVSAGSAFGTASPSKPASAFRIYVTPSAAGTLSIVRNQVSNPSTTVTENLNNGTLLTANANNIFDILVTDDEAISFKYSVGATFLSFKVYEVPAMIV